MYTVPGIFSILILQNIFFFFFQFLPSQSSTLSVLVSAKTAVFIPVFANQDDLIFHLCRTGQFLFLALAKQFKPFKNKTILALSNLFKILHDHKNPPFNNDIIRYWARFCFNFLQIQDNFPNSCTICCSNLFRFVCILSARLTCW